MLYRSPRPSFRYIVITTIIFLLRSGGLFSFLFGLTALPPPFLRNRRVARLRRLWRMPCESLPRAGIETIDGGGEREEKCQLVRRGVDARLYCNACRRAFFTLPLVGRTRREGGASQHQEELLYCFFFFWEGDFCFAVSPPRLQLPPVVFYIFSSIFFWFDTVE